MRVVLLIGAALVVPTVLGLGALILLLRWCPPPDDPQDDYMRGGS